MGIKPFKFLKRNFSRGFYAKFLGVLRLIWNRSHLCKMNTRGFYSFILMKPCFDLKRAPNFISLAIKANWANWSLLLSILMMKKKLTLCTHYIFLYFTKSFFCMHSDNLGKNIVRQTIPNQKNPPAPELQWRRSGELKSRQDFAKGMDWGVGMQ